MIDDMHLRLFAAELASRPLAMSAEAAAVAVMSLTSAGPAAVEPQSPAGASRPYDLDNGVATIAVHGQTVDRPTWLTDILGFSSYRRMSAALRAAIADPDVRGIVLDFDSPGGDFAGAPELAAEVRQASAKKPIVAHVDALAASAAYAIAAAAKHVIVTPSATVGSIGVVYMHLDRSAALAKSGVKPTVLHAGAFKADGNPYAALSPDARKRIQGQIQAMHEVLVESVGRHRPRLGASGARKTEAGLFMGRKAVDAGLADAVGGRDLARSYLFSAPAPASPVVAPSAPSAVRKAAVAAPSAPPSNQGANPMSAAAGLEFPALPPGHFYSADAVLKAAKREQRRAAANATVSRQLGAQSADDTWSEALASATPRAAGGFAPAPGSPKPAAAKDDVWTEALAKARPASPILECYR